MSDASDLTPDDVREILRLIDESGLDELELETPRFSIRLRRGEAAPLVPPARDELDGLVDVVAPMVGTFYRSSAPGAAPFVEVGSAVDELTQVCIIEVMKLMSSVTAGTRGVVAEICVQNGVSVEYGEVLFRVRPA